MYKIQTDTPDNFSLTQDAFRVYVLLYSSTGQASTLTQAPITPGLREQQQPPHVTSPISLDPYWQQKCVT